VFKAKAIELLFSYSLSGHARVASQALEALSSYQMLDIPSTVLPCDTSLMSPDPDPVTGGQLVNLFNLVPSESYSSLALLLSAMLKQEVGNVGRGVVSQALRQAQVSISIVSINVFIQQLMVSLLQLPTQLDKALSLLNESLVKTKPQSSKDYMTIGNITLLCMVDHLRMPMELARILYVNSVSQNKLTWPYFLH